MKLIETVRLKYFAIFCIHDLISDVKYMIINLQMKRNFFQETVFLILGLNFSTVRKLVTIKHAKSIYNTFSLKKRASDIANR